jgi:hypothetical protein
MLERLLKPKFIVFMVRYLPNPKTDELLLELKTRATRFAEVKDNSELETKIEPFIASLLEEKYIYIVKFSEKVFIFAGYEPLLKFSSGDKILVKHEEALLKVVKGEFVRKEKIRRVLFSILFAMLISLMLSYGTLDKPFSWSLYFILIVIGDLILRILEYILVGYCTDWAI